jgi:predicted MFS family arabinose efflux permease
MKRSLELALVLGLAATILGIGVTLGWRQAWIGFVFSAIWFIIAMILLTRPPGIPQVTPQSVESDLPAISRKESLPVLPRSHRVRISLSIACGISLVFWVMLMAA